MRYVQVNLIICKVLTKTQNRLFRFIHFQILHSEALLYFTLDEKFSSGIPNPKSKLFGNNRKITECSVPFHSIPGFSDLHL